MTISKLDNLPSEILHLIFASIAECSLQSLRNLSTVNKACYHTAASFIYRSVTVRVWSRVRLRRDITELKKNPLGQKRIQYVRRLKVTGRLPELENDPGDDETKYYTHNSNNGVLWSAVAEAAADESDSWMPLTSFVSSLQRLTDLIFDCDNRFPPCLLQALHQYHPSCRLDLPRFRFRSLHDPVTDRNELAVFTSPCLHSLSVIHVWRDSLGNDDYNEEAVMQAFPLAPNLKCLKMDSWRPASSAPLMMSLSTARKPWNGFVPPLETSNVGSLTSLYLNGGEEVTKAKLEKWSKLTDLSKLRSLRWRSVETAEALMDAAINSRFSNLELLDIQFKDPVNKVTFGPAVEMFFASLNPLTVLRLSGVFDQSLVTKVLEGHGSTLRELVLRPYPRELHQNDALVLTKADILNVQDRCPLLEVFKLVIKRSKSDFSETQCYEALRSFPMLSKVEIQLDCSTPPYPEPPSRSRENKDWVLKLWSHPDSTPRIYLGHMRDTLINAAIDEALARSIWDVISKNKPRRPLTYLEITSFGAGMFGSTIDGDVSTRVQNMARSFQMTRSERDDSDHVDIIELNKKQREKFDERDRKDVAEMIETLGHGWGNGRMKRLFERIWPQKAGSRDWRDDWSSMPLQRTAPSPKFRELM